MLFTSILKIRQFTLIGTCTGFVASNLSDIHVQKGSLHRSSTNSMKKPLQSLLSFTIENPESKTRHKKPARIAIIGGGLCGVTAARSLTQKIPRTQCEITVIEADSNSFGANHDKDNSCGSKINFWKAAAARNANSLVPGAAMNIMSQRKVIYSILRDYFGGKGCSGSTVFNKSLEEDFSTIPQYFGFEFIRCLGWNVPWVQKTCFFTFMKQFLKTSIFESEEGINARGKYLVKLASANRKILEKDKIYQGLLHQSGFISVHRTMESAQEALRKLEDFEQDGELISKENAVKLEPRLKLIPFTPSFFVHRINDSAANCEAYITSTIKSLLAKGVKYESSLGRVTEIRKNEPDGDGQFTIKTSRGIEMTYDYIIVANGIFAPILMSTLCPKARLECPTYPLKGYSLTLLESSGTIRDQQTLTKKALSFDNIYCTSVAPDSVRMAGIGEIAGWPRSNSDYQNTSSLAKEVLEKYAKVLFGDIMHVDVEDILPCYRPMSPDDVPIVGEVTAIKGLYLHTGHSTLGWTLSLATAECLAQTMRDDILGLESQDHFILPCGIKIEKSVLSPNRFL